ncbi:hypothetical protein LCGC14_2738120 [marine sediment metagenome]|uniref:Uncharacterized protein n=1 Tax=marine sediment metagenome TaxID=412755 RepID=A0A0F9BWY7_9ZZZZ
MKCPFDLPAKREFTHVNEAGVKYKVVIGERAIASYLTKDEADYIVQAINSYKKHEKLVGALKNANVWLGGKMEEPKYPTIWLKKYTRRHNECVEIIEQALKEKP